MCGIFGYIGKPSKIKLLVDGLKNLEYRGYDSSGVAYFKNNKIVLQKESGKIETLEQNLNQNIKFNAGIAHTRWATHGMATKQNAHPHVSFSGRFCLVHNGIIENYKELQEKYLKNVILSSSTDTEIVVHLLDIFFEKNVQKFLELHPQIENLENGFKIILKQKKSSNLKIKETEDILKSPELFNFESMSQSAKPPITNNDFSSEQTNQIILKTISDVCSLLKGSFAFAILALPNQNCIYIAKRGSPLMLGTSDRGVFFSSDVNTLSCFCNQFLIMSNDQIAILSKNGIDVLNSELKNVKKNFLLFETKNQLFKKQNCFMKEEIEFSSTALLQTLEVFDSQFEKILPNFWIGINCIYLVGCGTAFHSCLVGKKFLEKSFSVPILVEIASEFITGNQILNSATLCVFVSQSGETADTLAAMRMAKDAGCKILAITNNKTSSLAFESKQTLCMNAGWERAVASTKAYVCQIEMFYLLSAALRGTQEKSKKAIQSLAEALKAINCELWAKNLAKILPNYEKIIFIGRQTDYITALEASLKLKEISYINSIAIASGELKHGTLALVDSKTLIIAILTEEKFIDKNINSIKEVLARGGNVVVISQSTDAAKIFEIKNCIIDTNFVIDENIDKNENKNETRKTALAWKNKCLTSYDFGEQKEKPIETNIEGFKQAVKQTEKENSSNYENAKNIHAQIIENNINYNLILPKNPQDLYAISAIYPLQLLACEVSLALGYNPDMPRNLSKSVTVE